MQIEFLKSARMDDVLEVVTAPEEVKGASITLKQQILRADELLVEARVRVAFVCGGRGRAMPQALPTGARPDAGRTGGCSAGWSAPPNAPRLPRRRPLGPRGGCGRPAR